MNRRMVLCASLLMLSLIVTPSMAQSAANQTATPPADSEKTGADPRSRAEIERAMGPARVAENARVNAEKERAANAQMAAQGDAGIMLATRNLNSPEIGQGLVHSYDSWAPNPPVTSTMDQYVRAGIAMTRLPYDGRQRTCSHCGTTSELIVLRYLTGRTGVIMNDVSSVNGSAIFKLGVGWWQAAYSQTTYHIMECCDTTPAPRSSYFSSADQMLAVLRARVPSTVNNWAMAWPSSATDLRNKIVADVNNSVPVIASVNMAVLPYYSYDRSAVYGHFVVIDGYTINDDGTYSYSVNDPNDCSTQPRLGHHTVSESALWTAISGRLLLW